MERVHFPDMNSFHTKCASFCNVFMTPTDLVMDDYKTKMLEDLMSKTS